MPLECAIICLDTSEFMRNGDHTPTRLDAQQDAVHLVCGAKLRDNPESTVGVLTYGGSGVDVLSAPTDDNARIMAVLHGLKPSGTSHFVSALRVAALALRHRQNKHGTQRIVIFVGSPVTATPKELKKVGNDLRKNNIRVDIVGVGENDANQELLQGLIDNLNGSDGTESHFVVVPEGVLPSDVLVTSAVTLGEGGAASHQASFAEFGGVDPSMDPELASALRASLESSRAEVAATDTGGAGGAGGAAPPASGGGAEAMDMTEEEALLQQALAMSMQDEAPAAAPAPAPAPAPTGTPAPAPAASATGSGAEASPAGDSGFLDPSFVQSLLGSLPDVDLNDPKIQEAMNSLTKKDEDKDGKDKDGAGK